jgi:HK97 gp10 family phage protein
MMLSFQEDHLNKQVNAQINALEDRTKRGIRQFWFLLGKSLLKSFNTAVLEKPRGGRVYKIRRGRTRRKHTASQPGETPANISGNYRRLANYQIRGTDEMLFGNAADYAGFLENGTSKMEARPGLGNAVKDVEGDAIIDAANSVEKELNRL